MKTFEIYKAYIKHHNPKFKIMHETDVYFCELRCTLCNIESFCHKNYENMYFDIKEFYDIKKKYPEFFI